MAFQPSLQNTLASTGRTLYHLTHSCTRVIPGQSEYDDAHIHSCYEIYVNIAGEVSFLVNSRVMRLEQGGIVFTRPNDVHVCLYPTAREYEHYCLWIDDPEGNLLSFTQGESFSPFILLPPEEREEIGALLHAILEEGESELSKTASFLRILAILERGGQSRNSPVPLQIPAEMQKILNYIDASFSEIHHIREVYENFYISPATLTRWFRRYVGISPRAFLESKKIACAKELLGRGESVTQAALQAGFSDCSHFISVFKKKIGVTPKGYQQGKI